MIEPNLQSIIEQLKKDEGFSATPYWDNDHYTYGYGTESPGPNEIITEEQALFALTERVKVSISEFKNLFRAVNIDVVRQEAIINMLFNLGVARFTNFKKMVIAIYGEDWGRVAYEAFNSKWFHQLRRKGLTHIERSERIVWELLTGEKA